MTWDLFHPDGHAFYGAFKTREEAEKAARVLDFGFVACPSVENTSTQVEAA